MEWSRCATRPRRNKTNRLWARWPRRITALTGRAPVYGGVPGSTDGTILNARKGIPIVTCGPGDIHIPHHVDEWVSIDEIKLAARLYVVAAMRYLGVQDA